jgi:hypothetical protein
MAQEPDYKFNSDQIKDAILEADGNLADAARLLVAKWGVSCTRQYVKDAVDKRPELLGWYADFRQEVVDKAEGNIFRCVREGDYQASVLVVRTLGKERGWVPKEEVEAKVDGEVLLTKMSEGRKRARAALGEDTEASNGTSEEA